MRFSAWLCLCLLLLRMSLWSLISLVAVGATALYSSTLFSADCWFIQRWVPDSNKVNWSPSLGSDSWMWGTKGWDFLSPGSEVVKGEAWELPWPSVPPYRRSQWARNWSWQAERVKCLGCIWAPDYILSKTLLPPCHSYCLTITWNIKIASLNFPFFA